MSDDARMKPILVIPTNAMTPDSVMALRSNGICVVETEDPSKVKFLDPIPSAAERTRVEDAALSLSRKVLSTSFWTNGRESGAWQAVAATYLDALVNGTPLDSKPSPVEEERRIYQEAKNDELRKIAKEEAREARRKENERFAKEAAEREKAKAAAKVEADAKKPSEKKAP